MDCLVNTLSYGLLFLAVSGKRNLYRASVANLDGWVLPNGVALMGLKFRVRRLDGAQVSWRSARANECTFTESACAL